MKDDLEEKNDEKENASITKIASVDTAANITYFIIVGSMLDFSAGLDLKGVVASRAYASVMNTFIGSIY